MKQRYRSIDVIKGIAMIMVILVHYGQNFQFGVCEAFRYFQMGCPIFFVASGFGIACLVNKKYNGVLDKNNVGQFYVSRIKALAPGWYIAIIFIFCVNTVLLLIRGKTLSFGSNRDLLSIGCNFLFLNGLLPFCNNNVMPGGWYIGTTVVLYALTPIIIQKVGRAKGNRRIFFIYSSIIAMLIWVVMYCVFKENFSSNSFGYYFFLVHYPEFLLGMMLYFDFSESILLERQIKKCVPLAFVSLIIAIILFYVPVLFFEIFSAWSTALATYFILYYLLSNEQSKKTEHIWNILEKYGKNSYYIYLIHAFFAWPFVQACVKLCGKVGIPLMIPFVALIPITLILSFFAGSIFQKSVRKINDLIFSRKQ